MASQYRRVTGNPATRKGLAEARLQARVSRLPQVLAQKNMREVQARDARFQEKQIKMQKKTMAQRKREQEAALGLEAGKLGLNLAMSDLGGTTIGDIGRSAQNAVGSAKGMLPGGTKPTPIEAPKAGYTGVKGINVGGALASGLTGYGAGKLVGGKNKKKKAMYGAGAGALMGLLSGSKSGNAFGGMGAGLLAGGLGGYFS